MEFVNSESSGFSLPSLDDDEVVGGSSVISNMANSNIEDVLSSLAESSRAASMVPDERDVSVDEYDFSSSLSNFNIDDVLADAIDEGASDVHLQPNNNVFFSINGSKVRKVEYSVLSVYLLNNLFKELINNVLEDKLVNDWDLDASYVLKSGRHCGRRTRLAIGEMDDSYFYVFRIINESIPSISDLGISSDMVDWVEQQNGLALICGPTGTGKSTSLASLLDYVRINYNRKIVTIEKPIEYRYNNLSGVGLVTQREVGANVHSFMAGLTSAMRQDPDIILVGETRDRVECDALLFAAETGHLAVSTMHTVSPAATLNHIKAFYSSEDQARILASLGDLVCGFANQVLCRRMDGNGRVAVREVLNALDNGEVRDLIYRGDVEGVNDYQYRTKSAMVYKLARVVYDGVVDRDEARFNTRDKSGFDRALNELDKGRTIIY